MSINKFAAAVAIVFLTVSAASAQQVSRLEPEASAAAIATPEPATNVLIGGALVGLALAFRRKAKS